MLQLFNICPENFWELNMKILFVNHDISHYGAATSLSLMLRNNPYISLDMIVPKKGRYEEEDIKRRFDLCDGKVYYHNMSVDMTCYVGGLRKKITLRKKIEKCKDFAKFLFLAKFGKYDLIYINSLVLYKYVVKSKKVLIHIRERYEANGRPVLDHINKASGVIFIDNATFAPFRDHICTKYRIINNPFDMTGLSTINRADSFEHLDIKDKTVFSVIGQVVASKGIMEIVGSFHKVKDNNIILFIAGNCSDNFNDQILNSCDNDNRVVVLGHRDSVAELYNITDYLIRGERYQCIGRTIFEALFAGCFVLLPGTKSFQEFGKYFDKFSEKIYLYPPGDFDSLTKLIAEHAGKKVTKRKYYSNVAEHVQEVNMFLQDIVYST